MRYVSYVTCSVLSIMFGAALVCGYNGLIRQQVSRMDPQALRTEAAIALCEEWRVKNADPPVAQVDAPKYHAFMKGCVQAFLRDPRFTPWLHWHETLTDARNVCTRYANDHHAQGFSGLKDIAQCILAEPAEIGETQ